MVLSFLKKLITKNIVLMSAAVLLQTSALWKSTMRKKPSEMAQSVSVKLVAAEKYLAGTTMQAFASCVNLEKRVTLKESCWT